MTKDSALNDSKHSLTSICYFEVLLQFIPFLCEFDYYSQMVWSIVFHVSSWQMVRWHLHHHSDAVSVVNPSAWRHLNPSSYCDVGRFFYGVFKF